MRTIVLGLGKSGLAVYDLLAHEGCEVVGFDDNGQRVKEVQGRKVATHVNLSDFERVIVSPGVSLQHPLVHEAKRRGLQITGEAALALSRMHERMIAVTGTNGKTTVCSLIAHVLKHAGFKVAALGNIGAPLSEYVRMGGGAEMAIVELSSYQLETLSSPLFEVGLILNITPDHLDWHGSIEAYTAAKWRLRECVKEGGEFWVHETVSKIGLTYGKNRDCTLWTDQVALYPNNMKNRFLAASALPQNSHLHSRLAHKRGPLAPDENFEAPLCQSPDSSYCLGILHTVRYRVIIFI